MENVAAGVSIFRPPLFERDRVPIWIADKDKLFETFHVTIFADVCKMLINQLCWTALSDPKTIVLNYCGNDG
ncbi:uncharacterized protein DMAD_02415 [Drosophila madeirensis]|uniref:Uncharacterized protein n=1 Tax=Drosophila madeirensis TaxID=30013 RepID=A0AAU9G6C3_DROMD